MADTKISALTELAEAPADNDVLAIVDTSATATKKIQASNLKSGLQRKVFYTVGSADADYITDGTADDVQIQQAIDAADSAGGGTVYIKEGSYAISATLNLKTKVNIIGDGRSTILTLASGVEIEASAKNNIQLRNFYVDATGHTAATNVHAIEILNSTDVVIDKVDGDANAFGVFLNASGSSATERVWVKNCYWKGRGSCDVIGGGPENSTGAEVQDIWIENNYVYQDANAHANAYATAIDLVRCKRVSMNGNKTWGSIYFGSEQSPHNYSQISNNILKPANTANFCEIVVEAGADASPTAHKSLSVADNILQNGRIKITGTSGANTYQVDVVSNVVINNTSGAGGETIYLRYVTLSNVIGNIIQNRTGLDMDNCSSMIIDDNRFIDCATAYLSGAGNSSIYFGMGNKFLGSTVADFSGMNSLTHDSPAAGSSPAISAVGADANIDIKLKPKGTGIVEIPGTVAGQTIVSALTHSDNTNAASHARQRIYTGGGSGGDPYISMTVPGATDWSFGVDNSDSDKFKISNNDTLGTNDRITITTAGAVNVPGALTSDTLASQATMETGTATNEIVSPGRQQFHPSAAKFWVKATANSTTIVVSYNMTSWADTNIGDADGTIATDFSGADWCGVVNTFDTTNGWDAEEVQASGFNAQAAGTFGVLCATITDGGTAATSLTDPDFWMVLGFGDQ